MLMGLIEKHLVLVQFLSDIRIKSYVVFFLITFENLLFEDNSPTDHVLLSRELSIYILICESVFKGSRGLQV